MRVTTLAIFLGTGAFCFGAEPTSEHPYKDAYKKETFSKKAVLMTGVRATVGEITGSPKEWGRGIDGFGKRLASGFATHVVKNTIAYPIAAARHEDLLYHPSNKQGFGPRLGYALMSTVVTRKTTTGKKTVASGQISGTIGSALISRAWQPASAGSMGAGFSSAGISFGAQAGINVAREFWPRKKKIAPVSALDTQGQ